MDLYENIMKRKSTRRFLTEPLSADAMDRVRKEAERAPKLFESLPVEFLIVEDGEKLYGRMSGILGTYGKVKAPHYIIVAAGKKPGFRQAAGYSLEHLVLAINNLGIATCITAGGLSAEDLEGLAELKEDMLLVAAIAFGPPEVPEELYAAQRYHKRKPLPDLVLMGLVKRKYKDIFDAARLAPSYMNTQPWRFVIEDERIHLFRARMGFIKNALLKSNNKIDIGIALAHMVIAIRHKGLKFSLKSEPIEYPEAEYVVTIELKGHSARKERSS
jgi:nitroreductase